MGRLRNFLFRLRIAVKVSLVGRWVESILSLLTNKVSPKSVGIGRRCPIGRIRKLVNFDATA